MNYPFGRGSIMECGNVITSACYETRLNRVVAILLTFAANKKITAMILYNVTVKVETSAADEWVRWMKETHMPDLVNTGLFSDTRLCRLLEQDDSEGPTYAAQYYCNSIDDYNAYIDNHAPEMRERAFKAFGGKFAAFRTVMEII